MKYQWYGIAENFIIIRLKKAKNRPSKRHEDKHKNNEIFFK